MADRGSVLLITPPLTDPASSNLGKATLKALLARGGVRADTLYADLLFPRLPARRRLPVPFAMFYFVPALHPEVSRDELVAAALRFARERAGAGEVAPPPPGQEDAVRAALLANLDAAARCLERCVERARGYPVVGFSCLFEAQLVGALAIATRLKAENPAVRIAIGGAACFGETAEEIVRCYPVVDVACNCEGDAVVVDLVRALEQRGPLDQVPGIVWADGAGVHQNPAPPLIEDLDWLPLPDYDDLVEQIAASEWSDQRPGLYFETSRGCWWGQKHLCTFCGLNADGLAYRVKSPGRALREIATLHARYPTAERLLATDNILDIGYLRTVMPRLRELAARERPLRLFFEIKANLTREQVRALALAGVDRVQSGIESFSDGVLDLMDKGSTALMQVQAVKWLHEERIGNSYNVLIRNPGETAEQYREMTRLVSAIDHLPPPNLTEVILQRFSPYFNAPERHRISGVRPKPYYQVLFRAPGVDLQRMAYCFDYDHPDVDAEELVAARRAFVARLMAWEAMWRVDLAYYQDRGDHLEIVDQRGVRGKQVYRLPDLAGRIFLYLDRTRTFAAVARRFASVDEVVLRSLLEAWCHRRWVCRDGDRYLAVLPARAAARSRDCAAETPMLASAAS